MSATDKSDLADAYAGERIFLIGNGPSLAETPLDALQDEYTMAMNRIDLIYDAVDWRPDFYVCTYNMAGLRSRSGIQTSIKVHDFIDSTHLFLHTDLSELVSTPATDVTYLNVNYLRNIKMENPMNIDTATIEDADRSWLDQYWSYDISDVVWDFHTMYVAAQLSLWMGFDEIYFVGTDLGYNDPVHMIINNSIDPMEFVGQKWNYFRVAYRKSKLLSAILNGFATKLLLYIRKIGRTDLFLGPDDEHFTSEYQGQAIFRNSNGELERSHVVIKRICESEGVRVRNATIGGELEVYPRVNLVSLLRQL